MIPENCVGCRNRIGTHCGVLRSLREDCFVLRNAARHPPEEAIPANCRGCPRRAGDRCDTLYRFREDCFVARLDGKRAMGLVAGIEDDEVE